MSMQESCLGSPDTNGPDTHVSRCLVQWEHVCFQNQPSSWKQVCLITTLFRNQVQVIVLKQTTQPNPYFKQECFACTLDISEHFKQADSCVQCGKSAMCRKCMKRWRSEASTCPFCRYNPKPTPVLDNAFDYPTWSWSPDGSVENQEDSQVYLSSYQSSTLGSTPMTHITILGERVRFSFSRTSQRMSLIRFNIVSRRLNHAIRQHLEAPDPPSTVPPPPPPVHVLLQQEEKRRKECMVTERPKATLQHDLFGDSIQGKRASKREKYAKR